MPCGNETSGRQFSGSELPSSTLVESKAIEDAARDIREGTSRLRAAEPVQTPTPQPENVGEDNTTTSPEDPGKGEKPKRKRKVTPPSNKAIAAYRTVIIKGVNQDEAARLFTVNQSTISRWVKRVKTWGQGWQRAARPGRPDEPRKSLWTHASWIWANARTSESRSPGRTTDLRVPCSRKIFYAHRKSWSALIMHGVCTG